MRLLAPDFFFALLLVGLVSAAPAAQQRWVHVGNVPVLAMWPAGGEKLPVVIVSPAATGSPGNLTALCQPIAAAGYLVLVVAHSDAISPATTRPWVTGEALWRSRVADASAVVDGLPRIEAELKLSADREAVAVMGVGLGAETALLAAGNEPAWRGRKVELRDHRVKAVVAIAPTTRPAKSAVRALAVTGSDERWLTSSYDLLTIKDLGPRQLLNSADNPGPRDAAAAVITTFLDAQLKHDSNAEALIISGSVVAPFRAFASYESK